MSSEKENGTIKIRKFLVTFLNHQLKQKRSAFNSVEFLYNGVWGGALAGFIIAILVITMKWINGFGDVSIIKLYPVIFLFCITGGALTAWLCCKYALMLNANDTSRIKIIWFEIFIFIAGFILIFLIPQISARDALVPTGFYKYGNRSVGGPLGEPNLESLANGFVGGICFFFLAKGLSKANFQSYGFGIDDALKATIVGCAIWGLIFFIFRILTNFDIIKIGYTWYSSTFFIFEFPHPERITLALLIPFLFILTVMIISSGKWFYHAPKNFNSSSKSLRFIGKHNNKFHIELFIPGIYDTFEKLAMRDHCHELLLTFAVRRLHDVEDGGWVNKKEFGNYYQYLNRIADDIKIDRDILFERTKGKYRLSILPNNIKIYYNELSFYPELKEIFKAIKHKYDKA